MYTVNACKAGTENEMVKLEVTETLEFMQYITMLFLKVMHALQQESYFTVVKNASECSLLSPINCLW